MRGAEHGTELAGFGRRLAFSTIEMQRQADDEGLDLSRHDDLSDPLQRVGFLAMYGFDRMRHDADRIGRGNTDAGISVVDAQCRVGEVFDRSAHDLLEKLFGQQGRKVFDRIGLVAVGDEERVIGLHDDQVIDSEQGDV